MRSRWGWLRVIGGDGDEHGITLVKVSVVSNENIRRKTMEKNEDEEIFEREVQPWLEKKGIPQQNYRNLSFSDKILLHGWVCARSRPLSDRQLRNLYQKLHLQEFRDGSSPDMAYEELQNFFAPLSPSERLPYLYKF